MENRGPWAILRALLLSLLLLLLPPPSPPTPHTHLPLVLGHILSNQSAEDPSAVHLSSSPGQEPLLVLTFDVTKLTKVSSSFELQTWDPEGVIFYGDANVEDDWFMLGLRAGRPEIQMHNPWAQLTVGAGPPLNDGRWHKVDLKIKGDSLLLDVDGEEVLRLSQISGPLHNKSQHIMRLAIGGLLFPLSILRLPLVPALDGCLRRSTWLDPQAQISASAHRSGRSCDTDLQPGTFFPPGTRAEFSLQDLPQPCAEPWAFSVVLELKPTRDSGHLLALGTPENPSWLSLRLHDQKVVLSSGLEPGLDLPLAWKLPLQLTLNLSSAILSQGLEKKVLALSPLGLDPMFNLWAQPQGRLFLGALPGEDSLASFCLAGLWAQGQKLDMDRALNRSYNLWSHSCPSSPDNVTDTSY